MGIALLYESREWSTFKLAREIEEAGVPCTLVDLEADGWRDALDGCDLAVSRVFASAQFRGHERSLARMPQALARLAERGVPVLNAPRAHYFETSKAAQVRALTAAGIPAPRVFGVLRPDGVRAYADDLLAYPCVIKPDCGGRTTSTYIVRNAAEARAAMDDALDIAYVAEEYREPACGFITRIEVIGGACALIVKRSIADNGLSAWRFGSTYEHYADCPAPVQQAALDACALMGIEFGSLDVIEDAGGGFAVIDVNSVSNVAEENTDIFSFDLMKATAEHVVQRYRDLVE